MILGRSFGNVGGNLGAGKVALARGGGAARALLGFGVVALVAVLSLISAGITALFGGLSRAQSSPQESRHPQD